MHANSEAHVLAALLDSPVAKTAAAQHEKKIATRRMELERQRDILQAKAAQSFTEHQAALAQSMDAHAKAQAALQAAKARVGELMANRFGEIATLDRNITGLEVELRNTASPLIDGFIAEMRDSLDLTLKTVPIPTMLTITNLNTGVKTRVPGKPNVLPRDRAQAIREAIAVAESLKLQADQSDVPARLAALRGALPVVGAPAND